MFGKSGATMVGVQRQLRIFLGANRRNKRLGRHLGKLALGCRRFLRAAAAALGLLGLGLGLKRLQIGSENRDEFFHRLLHRLERADEQKQRHHRHVNDHGAEPGHRFMTAVQALQGRKIVHRLRSEFERRQLGRMDHLLDALDDALIPGQFDRSRHQKVLQVDVGIPGRMLQVHRLGSEFQRRQLGRIN